MRAIVSEKGQVTIPKPLRDRIGIAPGAVFEFQEEAGMLIASNARGEDVIVSVYGISTSTVRSTSSSKRCGAATRRLIQAVDTSVLLDVSPPTTRTAGRRRPRSRGRDGRGRSSHVTSCGRLRGFRLLQRRRRHFDRIGLGFDPLDDGTAALAGQSWGPYRRRDGTRARIVSDFLVAAHALRRADRLLTCDRGFTGRAFDELTVMPP